MTTNEQTRDNVRRHLLEAVHYTRTSLTDLFVLDPSDIDDLTTVAPLFDDVTT